MATATKFVQAQLSNDLSGSNACTIIAVLGALNLSKKTYFPSCATEITAAALYFKQVMIKGNILYQTLNLEPNNPNLEVVDVLQKIPELSLTIREDTGFFSEEDMINKFQSIQEKNGTVVGVLIIPPDKSMVIYMEQNKIGVMDSHSHGQHGGLITSCSSGDVKHFVNYVSQMAKKYWNANLAGSNFTILEPYS